MVLACLLIVTAAAGPVTADHEAVDRGIVRSGPPLTQDFTLTNRGPNSLSVIDVRSTCGCLAPKMDCRELLPGASAKLSVDVNTLSQPAGPIAWTTRVRYRAGGREFELPLTLRAELTREVQIEPSSLGFTIRRTRSVDVTVIDRRARPFTITGVGCTLPNVKAELVVMTDQHPARIRLTATPTINSGTQVGFAWFSTDDPLYPQVRVPVQVTGIGPSRVRALPSTVDIDPGATVRVQLADSEGAPVVVERIDADDFLKVEVESGTIARFRVTCQHRVSAKDGEIVIHLKQPAAGTVRIPVLIR